MDNNHFKKRRILDALKEKLEYQKKLLNNIDQLFDDIGKINIICDKILKESSRTVQKNTIATLERPYGGEAEPNFTYHESYKQHENYKQNHPKQNHYQQTHYQQTHYQQNHHQQNHPNKNNHQQNQDPTIEMKEIFLKTIEKLKHLSSSYLKAKENVNRASSYATYARFNTIAGVLSR